MSLIIEGPRGVVTARTDWIQAVSALPSRKSDFATGTGTQVGLQVTYDLRYDGSQEAQVIIVRVNPLPVQN